MGKQIGEGEEGGMIKDRSSDLTGGRSVTPGWSGSLNFPSEKKKKQRKNTAATRNLRKKRNMSPEDTAGQKIFSDRGVDRPN